MNPHSHDLQSDWLFTVKRITSVPIIYNTPSSADCRQHLCHWQRFSFQFTHTGILNHLWTENRGGDGREPEEEPRTDFHIHSAFSAAAVNLQREGRRGGSSLDALCRRSSVLLSLGLLALLVRALWNANQTWIVFRFTQEEEERPGAEIIMHF